jgi:AcrR family transcriptional regulator
VKTPAKNSSISTADRVLEVAHAVLRAEGASALTTRRVCESAGITAPTLYHHFGDKHGLMRALASRELHSFFAEKRSMRPTADAVADLMRGWDDWIGFARAKPQLVAALRQGDDGTIALRQAAEAIVMERLERLPKERPLRVPKDVAAQALVAGANTVVQLMLDGVEHRDLDKVNNLLKGALLAALVGPAGSR